MRTLLWTLALVAVTVPLAADASHACSAPGPERETLQGFWEGYVPVLKDVGVLARSYDCVGSATNWELIGTANYASAVGTWSCSRVVAASDGTVTSGHGSASQFGVPATGSCDGFPGWHPHNRVYFEGTERPLGLNHLRYLGDCPAACLPTATARAAGT